jgi:cation diffusion facilitator family transporter
VASNADASNPDSTGADRRRLRIALAANIAMFAVGIVGWWVAQSTALLADAFDMLADATGYAVTFWAVGRSRLHQQMAARWNGAMLIALGLGIIIEVIHRWITPQQPVGTLIMGFAALSLVVNGTVLGMLSRYRRSQQPHLRATWIDTRADVVVNVGVLVSGTAIAVTGYRMIDLITGAAISLFVIHEGIEIWRDSSESKG